LKEQVLLSAALSKHGRDTLLATIVSAVRPAAPSARKAALNSATFPPLSTKATAFTAETVNPYGLR